MREICRVCLARDNLSSLFEMEDNLLISDKIMSLASISISVDDKLPSSICSSCVERLRISYKFKLDCENSDKKLHVILNLETSKNTESIRNMSKATKERLAYIDPSMDFSENTVDNTDPEIKNKNVSEDTSSKFGESPETCLNKTLNMGDNAVKYECIKPQKEQCFTCGKVLSSRYRLKMHMHTHTGERPYTCNCCSKTFSLAATLKVHMRVHTGEKPLACSTCGKSFAHTAGLRAHVRLHTGEAPYRCSLCPNSFRTPSHLDYHIRQHTGEKKFECETCGKSFITQHARKRHAQTHTDYRPHVCHICGVRFLRLYYLKRHMVVHNRGRTFACNLCSATFKVELELLKHQNDHETSVAETSVAETSQCKVVIKDKLHLLKRGNSYENKEGENNSQGRLDADNNGGVND